MSSTRLLLLVLVLGGAACGRVSRVNVGLRGKPTPWNPEQVRQLAVEIETVVFGAAGRSEEQIVQQVGTELEFGEAEVDPAVLMGALDDLNYEIPTLEELHLDTEDVAASLRARQLRSPTLRHWKQRGCVGENADGKVMFVRCDAAKQDPRLGQRLAFMIIKENRNRLHVYQALVQNNRWSSRRYRDIRPLFAAAIHEIADPADLFAEGAGWVAKDLEALERRAVERQLPPRRVRRAVHRPEDWDDAQVLDVDVSAVPPRVIPQ